MLEKIKSFFIKSKEPEIIETKEPVPNGDSVFTTDFLTYNLNKVTVEKMRGQAVAQAIQRKTDDFIVSSGVMDSVGSQYNLKAQADPYSIPLAQMMYYASHSFIGYQACAIIAQHWLVDKACTMPARDALRKGYEVTSNDGKEVLTPEIIDAIKKADIKYKLNHHLLQFVRKGRIFGIRVVMFDIKSNDPEFYYKPFNIDGVTPGSYRGIVQIDPQWVSPELDMESASNPASLHFYEPTWWRVNNLRIHRSHLVIMRTDEVPDLLKPTYLYGGVPIPQKIAERVYAAERTANETPQLALTKRSIALHVDVKQALAQQVEFEKRIEAWTYFMNNWGVKVLGEEEKLEQFDTSLAELDNVTMSQYQLVAAASNVPAVKLMGTTPKGFNATGEYEEANYHEELESIQTHDLTPLIERHHLLLIKSKIAPEFGIAPFSTEIKWKPLDSITEKEQAEINLLKAQEAKTNVEAGALDGNDVRQRLIADPNSGYSGIPEELEEPLEEENLFNEGDETQEILSSEETAQESASG